MIKKRKQRYNFFLDKEAVDRLRNLLPAGVSMSSYINSIIVDVVNQSDLSDLESFKNKEFKDVTLGHLLDIVKNIVENK